MNTGDYPAISFLGGYRAANFQYAIEGTNKYAPSQGDPATHFVVNLLYVFSFHVAGTATIDLTGSGPLQGFDVTGAYTGLPAGLTLVHVQCGCRRSIGNDGPCLGFTWLERFAKRCF